jgi:hypothetical protein
MFEESPVIIARKRKTYVSALECLLSHFSHFIWFVDSLFGGVYIFPHFSVGGLDF